VSKTQDPTLAAMEAALRVLTALSQRCPPNPDDVALLVDFAGPQPEGADLDEFACLAVQNALKKREDRRRSRDV
jgi:hypothetical protein